METGNSSREEADGDPSSKPRKALCVVAVAWVFFATAAGTAQTLLISEVDTNQQDAAEFTNVSGVLLDISGWTVCLYDSQSWPNPATTFTFPSGTVIAPDAVVVLYENGGGEPPPGFIRFFVDTSLAWNSGASSKVAVLLLDAADTILDFFIAGGQSAVVTPGAITQPQTIPPSEWVGPIVTGQNIAQPTWHRQGAVDHNDATDWALGDENIGNLDDDIVFPGMHPRVLSITLDNPNPTTGPLVSFTVYFSVDVTGIETSASGPFNDFALTVTGGALTGTIISGVTAIDGKTYHVAANTGFGTGTLRLDVLAAGGILDAELQGMLGDYTDGPEYLVDTVPPSVTAVLVSPDSPGIGDTVMLVTSFDEATNPAVTPLVSVETESNGVIAASSVANGGDGAWLSTTQYAVSLDRATIAADHGVAIITISGAQDAVGNTMFADSGYAFFIDGEPPTITVNSSVTADTTPPLCGTIEDNDLAGCSILLTLDGVTFNAPTNHGDGTWTLPDNALSPLSPGIYDVLVIATDPAGNIGTDTTSDKLTIDLTHMAVNGIELLDPSPTNMPEVRFRVTLSSEAQGVETGNTGPFDDFAVRAVSGAISGASVRSVQYTGCARYLVTVNIGTGDGKLCLDVVRTGGLENAYGYPLPADYRDGPAYAIDHLKFVSLPPADVTVPRGRTMQLEVAAAGGTPPYSYEWQFELASKAYVPVGDDAPVLVLELVDFDDAGLYVCTVNDLYEMVTTSPTSLHVSPGVPVSNLLGLCVTSLLLALCGAGALRERKR